MIRSRTFPTIILLLCIAWGLLTIRIGAPWVGHQDANGAWISSAIRNYERYGFAALGGMIVLNNGIVQADDYAYYANHPPLPVWLPTLPVLLVGYDETIVRFVFAACTLLSIATLYAVVHRLFGQKPAIWSAAFYAFTPMTIYFGRMPDHEAPALMLLMLFVWVLIRYLKRPTKVRWLVLAVLIFAEAWTAWGGLICVFAVCAAGLWAGKASQRRGIFLLVLIGVIGAVFVFSFYQLQWSGTFGSFIQKFLWRTSDQSFGEGLESFTIRQYAVRIFMRCITLFTPTISLIAVLGLPPILRNPSTLRRLLPPALVLGGLSFILLFRNASYIHDYYLIYTTPGIAIFTGVGLWLRWQQRNSRRWMRPLLLGMLLMTPVSLWYYTSALDQGSDQTDPLVIAQVIQQQTNPADLIMSNLPTVGTAIEFYASRDIQWSIMPNEAVAMSIQHQGVVYFHCGESGELPSEVSVLSDSEVISVCHLTRLS